MHRDYSLTRPDHVTPRLPHLEFVDLEGHGYAKVRLSTDAMRTEFVCIPRPITRSEKPDGGQSGIGFHSLLRCGRAASAPS